MKFQTITLTIRFAEAFSIIRAQLGGNKAENLDAIGPQTTSCFHWTWSWRIVVGNKACTNLRANDDDDLQRSRVVIF